jgi:hypothetical protein
MVERTFGILAKQRIFLRPLDVKPDFVTASLEFATFFTIPRRKMMGFILLVLCANIFKKVFELLVLETASEALM